MNKNDAKVFKALAECGFDHGNEIPDPEVDMDALFKLALDEKEIFLEQVEILFADDKKIVTISDKINNSLKKEIITK